MHQVPPPFLSSQDFEQWKKVGGSEMEIKKKYITADVLSKF